ncbi:probable carotenoid cleavage dioxygenase 4, chloroplastic [Impatiens glandulifera]|uniref:probable carotenoid cleavage dioxygenase 4, chloroplastic n=1 Tax=Impatiens glandulifera TaxID=253017 RepID=UPI001FB14EC6|nr:probable carotenoid cleavage dioxygenase 4, chloroplastic [Impatiens glandulifera]
MDSFSSNFLSPFSLSITKLHVWPPAVNKIPSTIYISKPRSCLHYEKKPIRRIGSSLAATILNTFDDIINKFIDPPVLRPSVDPRLILTDNFAPVDELPPSECELIFGHLPKCLDGVYIRNGPNPQFIPRGPYHHFDGDGMLHAIRISNGRATLCSRYVKTYKFSVEREIGGPVVPNFFSDFYGLFGSVSRATLAIVRILAGQFNPMNGIGLANTSLALISGGLYALCESDLPYAVKISPVDGDVVTVGRHDFGGKLLMNMTAHPKIDPETKEAFAFRYSLIRPILTYFRFDPDGNKQPDVPIFSVKSPSLFHDFAITKKYAIFVDIQIGFTPLEVIFGSGSPIGVDPKKVSRVGIIPRYATNEAEMRWFDVPGLNSLHAVNAWEEEGGETVVMVVANIITTEHMPGRMDLTFIRVEKVTIDMRNDVVCIQPLSERNLELVVINPNYTAKKIRYVYASIGDPLPKISGLVKLDISISEHDGKDCTVASRMFGPGCYGGEPFFVAKEPDNLMADEDDGYLITYVHNENTGESRFMVMDARSPFLEVVAIVRLPQRVPYGFHGLFLRENEIKNM